jgi:hypothetical protein
MAAARLPPWGHPAAPQRNLPLFLRRPCLPGQLDRYMGGWLTDPQAQWSVIRRCAGPPGGIICTLRQTEAHPRVMHDGLPSPPPKLLWLFAEASPRLVVWRYNEPMESGMSVMIVTRTEQINAIMGYGSSPVICHPSALCLSCGDEPTSALRMPGSDTIGLGGLGCGSRVRI